MESRIDAGSVQRASLDRLVETQLRAVGDSDLETLLTTMTDDIEYDIVGTSANPVRGKDAVRAHYLQEFANAVQERHIPLRRLYGEGFVIDELVWEGRITGRAGSLLGKGRRVSHRVLRIFEVRDGLVTRQSVYSDHAALARQLS
jgi:ketosteroid isomerase-like protein